MKITKEHQKDEEVTYGQKYGPAMKVTTKEEATAYLEMCIEHTMRLLPDLSEEEARAIELQNMGYYVGYYDRETFERVMKLYETVHPIFGKDSSIFGSPEKAFDIGKRA